MQFDFEISKRNLAKISKNVVTIFCFLCAERMKCSCICLMYAYEYFKTGDASFAAYSAQKITEALEIYLYETAGTEITEEDVDKILENSGLIKKELKWQDDTIKQLQDHAEDLSVYLNEIRSLNNKYKLPNV